jgi:hypothetical protein
LRPNKDEPSRAEVPVFILGGAALDLYGFFREDGKGVEDSAVMLTAIHAVADTDPIGPSARRQTDGTAQATAGVLGFIHVSHQSKSSPGGAVARSFGSIAMLEHPRRNAV